MNQKNLHSLSIAELVDLVVQMRTAYEELHASSSSLSQLSADVKGLLDPQASDSASEPLKAMGEFLTTEHSFADMAEILQDQSVGVFGANYGLLFLSTDTGGLSLAALPEQLLDDGMIELADQAASAARQAQEGETTVTLPGVGQYPVAFAALPLERHATLLGVFVLCYKQNGDITFSPEIWSLLTVFSGVVAAACANMKRVVELKQQSMILEGMVAQRTRQLQSSRDLLRVMFDHLPDGVLLLDSNNVVVAANQVFCTRLFDRHPREIVGMPYAAVWREIQKRSKQHNQPATFETPRKVQCTDVDNEKHWYEISRVEIDSDADIPANALEFWRMDD